jgi:hypothetical protein
MTTRKLTHGAAHSRRRDPAANLASRLVAFLPGTGRAKLAGSAALLITVTAAVSTASLAPAGAATTAGTAGSQAAQANCMPLPSACGFPDATNTGVPAGVGLQQVPGQVTKGPGWAWNKAGYMEVSGNGAVISGLSIAGNLDISASNVTVSNVTVVSSGQSSFGVSLRHTSNVTVEHSTISGVNATSGRLAVGVKDVYGDSTGTQVLANNIYYAATGVQMSAGLIKDNYIHDMGFLPGDHVNGTTSNGGTTPMTIEHNTILNNMNQTDAVSLFQDNGPQANRVIDDNLLGGGGYSIYGGTKAGGTPTSNIQITNNVISTVYYPRGGQWGPVAYYNSGSGNVWSGNTWDGNGQTIPSP